MAQPQGAKPSMISEIGLAIFVILLIVLLIVELPSWIVNFAISFNNYPLVFGLKLLGFG